MATKKILTDLDLKGKIDATGTVLGSNLSGTNTGDQISSDFNHDDLTGFVADEHIDWTTDQGSTNIHANNYTNTNTFRAIHDTPVDGATTTSISSNWAFDNVKTAVPTGALFTDSDTTYVSSDFNHDDLTGFVADEHIDWTADQGATNIHSGNYTNTNTWNANSKNVAGYVAAPGAVANKVWKTDASGNPAWRDDVDTDSNTFRTVAVDTNGDGSANNTLAAGETLQFKKGSNITLSEAAGVLTISSANDNTTYVSSDFTHDDLTGFVANEHIDWTTDQGATNIHSGNYSNTQRAIHDTPANGATTTSISSNWAFDNVKTAVPSGALFTDTNTTYVSSDFNHDDLTGFVAKEHLDWTADQGANNIHANNYTNTDTTYVSSDFNHDDLTGFVSTEHIDWTTDQGAMNIHSGNYTDTNTHRAISSTPTNGASTTSISSDWAFDNVKTAVPSGALFTDTNTTYTSSDFNHDDLTGFEADEHIDWTVDQGATNIHSGNYINTGDTTYVSSDFTHDDLTGFVANEHIDWTIDQGATNIHANNYTDTNTFRAISSTPTNGATTTSISSDWAFDNVKTAVPTGALFTDTNTFRAISSTPTNGATTTSISSDWAFDNVKTAVPSGAVFTDTQNTYTSSDFTHDNLTGFVANEHIDWTTDQGATNIHANNYTNTNTNQLTTFQVEDGDGTEVTISHGKEWKFTEGQGINVNWTDTSTGSDGDPFDLQFALKSGGVRATELNVSGNGTSSQYLRSDGDGSFTWATPSDTNTVTNISIAHGADAVTVVSSDGTDGTINEATTSLAGVINTGPQSLAGIKTFVSTLKATGGAFEVLSGSDRLFEVEDTGYFHLGDVDGLGDEHYIQSTSNGFQVFISGAEKFRLNSSGVAHFDDDVIAYSTTISDRRLKDDIQTIENASETVKKLRGVSYEWNAGNRKGQKEIGLVAQEVEEVLPFLVREHELPLTEGAIEGELYKTVDYEKLVGLLIEDSKEKDARIERLEAMVEIMLNK